MSAAAEKALPDGYKRWLIASVAVLLASLLLFVINVVAGFAYFTANSTPVWVTVLSALAIFGIAVGFGGLFVLLAMGAVSAYRSEKRRAAAKG